MISIHFTGFLSWNHSKFKFVNIVKHFGTVSMKKKFSIPRTIGEQDRFEEYECIFNEPPYNKVRGNEEIFKSRIRLES